MNVSKTALNLAEEYAFPGGCALCGQALFDARAARYSLCETCRETLRPETGERCVRCGRPLVSETGLCMDCREAAENSGPPAYDKLFCMFPYTGKHQNLLTAFKYGKRRGAGRFLAEQIPAALEDLLAGRAGRPALVPVPPRPGKIRAGGWDQIAYLARLLDREGRDPVFPCLRRVAPEPQKHLSREKRRENLRDGILCIQKPPPFCVVFDDIITTGATMDACAAALKSAGAAKVYGICLFYG